MGEVAAPRAQSHGAGIDQQREAFRAFMTSRRLRPTIWAKQAGVASGEILGYLTGRSRGFSAGGGGKTGARRQGAGRRHVQMISVEEATGRILAAFRPLESERIALAGRRRAHTGRRCPRAKRSAALSHFRDGRLCRAEAPIRTRAA